MGSKTGINCMKRIIKLNQGDTIPENAKFLSSDKQKVVLGRYTDYGFIFDTEYTRYGYKIIFYYEIDDNVGE